MSRWHEAGARICFAIGMVASVSLLGRAVGFASPWFALIAAFCVLGLLDLAMPFVRSRMPRYLRQVRTSEARSRAYRALGVPMFGEFLRRTPLRLLNRRVYLTALHRDFTSVRTHLEDAEAAHFWGGVATIPYLALAWSRGWWSALTSVMIFNLVVNLYPILHLRSVRARIDETVARKRALLLGRKQGYPRPRSIF